MDDRIFIHPSGFVPRIYLTPRGRRHMIISPIDAEIDIALWVDHNNNRIRMPDPVHGRKFFPPMVALPDEQRSYQMVTEIGDM